MRNGIGGRSAGSSTFMKFQGFQLLYDPMSAHRGEVAADRRRCPCQVHRRPAPGSGVPPAHPPIQVSATFGAARRPPGRAPVPRRRGAGRGAGGVRAVGTEAAGRPPSAGPNGRPRALRRTGAFRWEPKRRRGMWRLRARAATRSAAVPARTGISRRPIAVPGRPRRLTHLHDRHLAECRSIRRAGRARRAVRGARRGGRRFGGATVDGPRAARRGAGRGRAAGHCAGREVPVPAGRMAWRLAAVLLPGMRRRPGMSSSG